MGAAASLHLIDLCILNYEKLISPNEISFYRNTSRNNNVLVFFFLYLHIQITDNVGVKCCPKFHRPVSRPGEADLNISLIYTYNKSVERSILYMKYISKITIRG